MRTTLPRLGVVALFLSASAPALAQVGPDEEPTPPSLSNQSHAAGPTSPAESVSKSVTPEPGGETQVPDSMLPTLVGPIGLYHVSTAEVGPANHLRLGLHGQYFRGSDFLVKGDTDTRVDGVLTFGYTPHRYIELFGAMLTSSNRNVRPMETSRRD